MLMIAIAIRKGGAIIGHGDVVIGMMQFSQFTTSNIVRKHEISLETAPNPLFQQWINCYENLTMRLI